MIWKDYFIQKIICPIFIGLYFKLKTTLDFEAVKATIITGNEWMMLNMKL